MRCENKGESERKKRHQFRYFVSSQQTDGRSIDDGAKEQRVS